MSLSPARQALWEDRHEPNKRLTDADRSFLKRHRSLLNLEVLDHEIDRPLFDSCLAIAGRIGPNHAPDRRERALYLRIIVKHWMARVTRDGVDPLAEPMVRRPNRFAETPTMPSPNPDADVAAMCKLLAGIEKPAVVAAAERAYAEARRAIASAEDAVRARRIALGERGMFESTDGRLTALQLQLQAAVNARHKAFAALERARAVTIEQWIERTRSASPDIARLLDAALAHVMALAAPLGEAADAFDTMQGSPPQDVRYGREIHAWCARQRARINSALPATENVRFLEAVRANAGAPDEIVCAAGEVRELPEASARRWISRGLAQPAELPWQPPVLVRIRLKRDYADAGGPPRSVRAALKAGEVHAVAEPLARELVEYGLADPEEPGFWDTLAAGARSAAAALGVAVPNGATVEARRGAPRSLPS